MKNLLFLCLCLFLSGPGCIMDSGPDYVKCQTCRGTGRTVCPECLGTGEELHRMEYSVIKAYGAVTGLLSLTQTCTVEVANTDVRAGVFSVLFTLRDEAGSHKIVSEYIQPQTKAAIRADFDLGFLGSGTTWGYEVFADGYMVACSRCEGIGSVVCFICRGYGKVREA